jgi:3-phosphoshikimate 1-carboxyvinyltransferase
MLRFLGVPIEQRDRTVRLRGGQSWAGRDIEVPADPSAAAFLLGAALIVPDSEITVRNLCVNPTRTGFFDIIRRMGADLQFTNERETCGEPVADITARFSRLQGVEVPPDAVPRAIDEFPLLAAIALFAEGRTVITGARELRVKESDRISTMTEVLTRLGGRLREREDGLEIFGGEQLRGTTCRSHGDHRVAMALAVAGSAIEGELNIEDTACVKTSFPGFWEKLNALGGRCEESS